MIDWRAIAAFFRDLAAQAPDLRDRADYLRWAGDCDHPDNLPAPYVLPPVDQGSLLAELLK